MTLRRSRAYGRVMRALRSPSAVAGLTSDDRERLREAADTLVLARIYDGDARHALAAARAVVLSIRRDQLEPWIEQLADDLEDCGPLPISLFAISAQAWDGSPLEQREGSAPG